MSIKSVFIFYLFFLLLANFDKHYEGEKEDSDIINNKFNLNLFNKVGNILIHKFK